ncbi:MAG: nickel pincer cofactor biosynthesis protein LarC [Lachnospiraceae bacterium]
MGQTLYLECNSGISGDMAVAALLDLGANEEVLRNALYSMGITGFGIEISRVKKAGLDVCDFNVKLDKEHENHDHNMEYLHGHEASDGHKEWYNNEGCHGHSHNMEEHNHNGHAHSDRNLHDDGHSHQDIHAPQAGHTHHDGHVHRGLPEIQEIIEHADISSRAKKTALKIFNIIAHAEAQAHGTDIDNVHFHEVGAIDSIVDIVAAAVCLDNLDITEVIVPYLCEGTGTIRCQHGILPVPVPAVANIVQMYGLPLRIHKTQGEFVTPTGAAIAAAIRSKNVLPEQFTIQKTGMGAGKRNYERPSILRAMLIKAETGHKEDIVYKLETNIDDCTGEALGYVMERLFENGAADVNYIPVFMKKNRPAYLLTVLCQEKYVNCLENIIFNETTTIGIRKSRMERTVLERKPVTVELPFGKMPAKKCILPDGSIRIYPEYEIIAKTAKEKGMSIQEVFNIFHKYMEEKNNATN